MVLQNALGDLSLEDTQQDVLTELREKGIVKSTLNSTTATLLAGATYTGTWEDITSYPQVTFTITGRPSVFQGDANTAVGTVIFEFSNDGGATVDTLVPTLVLDPGYFIPYPLITVATHYRIRYLNDGGAFLGYAYTARNLTVFRLTTLLHHQATKELARTLAQEIRVDQPATLVRAVGTGLNPASQFVNAVQAGTYPLTPATSNLGVSGVYTSNVIDIDLYPSLLLLVGADQASAADGVLLEFSDTLAFTTVRSTMRRTFRTGNITEGLMIPSRARARYLRIKYTNGLTAQGRFYLDLHLNPMPLPVEIDLIPTTKAQTGQQDVTLTASQVATGALTGRKTLRLKNLSGSARSLYYGFTAGVTTGNGDELAAGEPVDLDIDEFVTVYVLTTSTGGAGVRCAWTEIGN